MTREAMDQFCAILCTIRNDALQKVIPTNPAPWETSLKECGVSAVEMEHASYVLAAFADDRAGADLQVWSQGARSGWIWVLFHEAAAGVEYYARMEQLASCGNVGFIYYWLGVKAGFQGRFAEDSAGLDEWLHTHKLWDVPKGLPQTIAWPEDGTILRMERPLGWWQPVLVTLLGLLCYGILVWLAQGGV